MAASATFALKPGVWFRRGRLGMVSPDSQGTACPPSGRNSTYRPVQISGTGSNPFGSFLHSQANQAVEHTKEQNVGGSRSIFQFSASSCVKFADRRYKHGRGEWLRCSLLPITGLPKPP